MNMRMNAFMRNHFLNMNLMEPEIKYRDRELVLEDELELELDDQEASEEYDDC